MNSPISSSNWLGIIPLSLALLLVGCSDAENEPSTETAGGAPEVTTDDVVEEASEETSEEVSEDATLEDADITPPELELAADKTFRITWEPREGALSYRVFENPDGAEGFSPISDDLDVSTLSLDHRVALYLRVSASYLVEICYAAGCVNSESAFVSGTLDDAVGYIKASNAEGGSLSPGQNESPAVIGGDRFGSSMSLSADGRTLAVTAPGEDSAAMGLNGNQDDNDDPESGAVYVFVRGNERWQQQAYLKADDPERRCCLGGTAVSPGTSLSLSGDGDTLAVAAYSYQSGTSGEVYIFTRSNGVWQQQASVNAGFTTDAEGETIVNGFGASVRLASDGDTLVVGAPGERSASTGVNGNQSDSSVADAGAAYVFSTC